jgi:hypothetical protein
MTVPPSVEGDASMRSLWRMIAARWLGGQASDALTGDAALFDLLTPGDMNAPPPFVVRRQSEVSHRAMMSQQDRVAPERETTLGNGVATDRDG